MSSRGPRYLRSYKRFRATGYQVVRTMGTVQPWLELSPRKIVRRWIYRRLGVLFSRQLFGGGWVARTIKHALGL